MALILNIPTLLESPVFIAETRPQKILQLLQEIDTENALDVATHLRNELESLNRQKVSSNQRLQALECYRSLISNITVTLNADYINATLPLDDKEKSAASACEQLWLELGYGYKLALVDLQNQLIKLRTDKSSALAIQRAMHAIAEYALVHYQTYVTPPNHIWSDLHQLYFCAAKLGLLHTEIINSPISKQKENYAHLLNTIESTYKHTLLVNLSQPNHLIQQDISTMNEYLAHHVQAARVTAIETIENSSGAFIINLTSNSAPAPYSKKKSELDPDSELILHTIDLIRSIHEDLNMLQNRTKASGSSIPKDANRHDYITLLSYLITNWGISPKRIFSRSDKNGDIDAVVGIDNIYNVIASQAASFPDNSSTTTQPSYSRWKILNISATGISIRRHHTAEKNIKVGNLIALKAINEQQWSIGFVKWANCGTRDRLDIGIQLIAPSADAAIAQTFQQNTDSKVLVLPEITAVNQPATIIAPRGTYVDERQLTLTQKQKTVRAVLKSLSNRTHDIERILFSTIN